MGTILYDLFGDYCENCGRNTILSELGLCPTCEKEIYGGDDEIIEY